MSFHMYDHYFDYYLQSIFGGTVDTEVKTKILAPYCHSEEPAARSINRGHWQLPYVGLISRAPLGTPLPAIAGIGVIMGNKLVSLLCHCWQLRLNMAANITDQVTPRNEMTRSIKRRKRQSLHVGLVSSNCIWDSSLRSEWQEGEHVPSYSGWGYKHKGIVLIRAVLVSLLS